MAIRAAKRRITVWSLLIVLALLTALAGCKKQTEPAAPAPGSNEPNAATTAPAAEPNA
jgi:uncharacterized lipoprotein YajG